LVGEKESRPGNILHVHLWEARGEPQPWRVHLRAFGTPARRVEASYDDAAEAREVLDELYEQTRELGSWSVSAWAGEQWGGLQTVGGRVMVSEPDA